MTFAVLPTGRNVGRKTQKWLLKNISGQKNRRPNFVQICQKMAEIWPNFFEVFSQKTLIISKNRLFNTLMGSTFLLRFCGRSL
jgi:hypothetical protein